MIKKDLAMKFITERDELGNEKYRKITLKIRPEVVDEQLREVVDRYDEMTSNELVEAIVVVTRELDGNGDIEELEEIFFDEEQEMPDAGTEKGSDQREAKNSLDQTEVPEVEFIPDKKDPLVSSNIPECEGVDDAD